MGDSRSIVDASHLVNVQDAMVTEHSRTRLSRYLSDVANNNSLSSALTEMMRIERSLGFLLVDHHGDDAVPMNFGICPDKPVNGRVLLNTKRRLRGDVDILKSMCIISPLAQPSSYAYEIYPNDVRGDDTVLQYCSHDDIRGTRCLLCSGVGGGDAGYPCDMHTAYPNQIFIRTSLLDDDNVYIGANYAAICPMHFTVLSLPPTQQRIYRHTIPRMVELLRKLNVEHHHYSVIHNGHLIRRDGKAVGAGASILHDHMQFMDVRVPILDAEYDVSRTNDKGTSVGVLSWPGCVICVRGGGGDDVGTEAWHVMERWLSRDAMNTANLIACHDDDGDVVVFITLRRIGVVNNGHAFASIETSGLMIVDDDEEYSRIRDNQTADDDYAYKMNEIDPLREDPDRKYVLHGLLDI